MNRASEVAAAFAEWCWVHWHGGEGGGQLVTIAAPVSGDLGANVSMKVVSAVFIASQRNTRCLHPAPSLQASRLAESANRAALLQMRVGGFGLVGERHLCSSGSGTCRFVAEIRLSFRTFFRVSCAYEPQAG